MSINETTYGETTRRLSMTARVVALDVIRRARALMLELAGRVGASDALRRLVLSDVVESILAKHLEQASTSPEFAHLTTPQERAAAFEAYLFATLLGWMLRRANEDDAARLALGVRDLYKEPGLR